jgi:hypothetical protein
MKLDILACGYNAKHDRIRHIQNLQDRLSISDVDAFVFDALSLGFGQTPPDAFQRRAAEISALLTKKDGVVVATLRPNIQLAGNQFQSSARLILTSNDPARLLLETHVGVGHGTQLRLSASARGPAAEFLRALKSTLQFDAFLTRPEPDIKSIGGIVLAINSTEDVIGVEFRVGGGRVCLLPTSTAPPEQIGAALYNLVREHYGGPDDLSPPDWASGIAVPGSEKFAIDIAKLESTRDEVLRHISDLRRERDALESFKGLLYGTGKRVLEPIVRGAFRTLGFDVPDPERYTGEWDLELTEPSSGKTGLAEVEGSEGQVDVRKQRQLLSYIQEEILEARQHKGLLIGNGFRLLSPTAPERSDQFTEHASRGCIANGYAMVPCTELFAAVIGVLSESEPELLKAKVRQSLMAAVGLWKFQP